jgi:predicted house-cleaning NTP pyrophosphatase (Maf/HAM1 superfamily)
VPDRRDVDAEARVQLRAARGRQWPSNSAFVLTRRYQRTKQLNGVYPTTENTTVTFRHAPEQVDLG